MVNAHVARIAADAIQGRGRGDERAGRRESGPEPVEGRGIKEAWSMTSLCHASRGSLTVHTFQYEALFG